MCGPGLMCCLDNDCEHKCTQPALDDGKKMERNSFICVPGVLPYIRYLRVCHCEG